MTKKRPPAELYPGAVDRGNGCVTFALYAPGKQSVHVIGDFNDWNRSADPLQSTKEGLWWIEKQLEPGSNAYQFLVDEELVIGDPYARALADDTAQDPPRSIVTVGAKPYSWQHDDWQRPLFHQLIIYEIHIGDFTEEGTFQAAIKKLDYLHDLGINAVELMPVFEYPGWRGWGYNPAYFFTVEKAYGTPDDLRQFIDEAHARSIAVILDIVLTHTGHDHPFNKLYPYEESPWYGTPLGEENQFGFPSFDYTKGPAQAFARDVQDYWLREFHIDGFRYDYLLGLGMKDGMGLPYLVHTAREVRPDVYLIGEYSPENPEAVNASGLNGAWHVLGRYKLVALLREGELNEHNWDDFDAVTNFLDPWKCGYNSAAKVVNYVESHDEQRVIEAVREAGLDEDAARHKSALAASVLMTMPGEPMLYHGQEWGEATQHKPNERNLIHWEQLESEAGRGLFEHYKKMCWLRRHHPALYSENFSLDARYPKQKALVYHRWNEQGDDIIVAVNFSPNQQKVTIPFPNAGRWHDAISGQEIEAEDDYDFDLEPSTAAIFIREG